MKNNLLFTRLICLLLTCVFIFTLTSSCGKKSSGNESTKTVTDSGDSKPSGDDGSALALTRYQFTGGKEAQKTLESLIGTINDSNGLLWYKFDEAEGTTTLVSSLTSPRNSTAMNASLIANGGVSGGAVSFDGNGAGVKLNNGFTAVSQITSSTFLHPAYSAISVAFYFKPDSLSGNQLIYEQGDSSNGLAVAVSDGVLKAAVGAGSSETGKGTPAVLEYTLPAGSAEEWTHVAVVFDGAIGGGTVTLYVNGAEAAVKTDAGAFIPQTLDAAGLGAPVYGTNVLSLTGNACYKGKLDDLRIYSTAITYSGSLEENAVFLQSAAAKNYYIKAGSTLTCDAMVAPELRGFVLTYGLSDSDGYSFRQSGTDYFICNDNGSLTIKGVASDAEKKSATFYMENALAYPTWSSGKEGAFRSYRAADTELYITASNGKVTLSKPGTATSLNAVFKVTGDQTKVVSDLRGAVYYPSYALNAPQFWKWYDHEIIDRDMSYATEILGINAFRIWVSYEYWREDSAHFEAAFKDFLDLAGKHGILIMVSLFEGCGNSYSYDGKITWSRQYTGNLASWSVTSPSSAIYDNARKWNEPKEFITFFINEFGDDSRLLAIETYNEPWGSRSDLAKFLTEYAVTIQKSVPLTVGTAPADPINIVYSVKAGMDLIQYHDNFPGSTAAFKSNAEGKMAQGLAANLPVYCTEVQWVGGPKNINYPVYSNLAPTCNQLMQSGSWAPFYWTLMVHPCYLDSYRNNYKMYNGLINEDGTVNNKANAKAVNNGTISAEESKLIPYDDGSYSYRYNFSDSFFDLHAYKWTVSSGEFSASSGSFVGSGLAFANNTAFDCFTASFSLEGEGSFIFGAKDKNNYFAVTYSGNIITITGTSDGTTEVLAASSAVQGEKNSSHEISVTVTGSQIKASSNCTEAVAEVSHTTGLIGFMADSSASFDNLSVSCK